MILVDSSNRSLSEFRQFCGFLEANGSVAPVTFRARINSSGEVEFDFDKIAITKETSFIDDQWYPNGSSLSYFSLSGKTGDGIELITHSFSELEIDEVGDHILLTGGRCSKAIFHRKLAESKPKPWIRMLLKGFRSSHPLKLNCRLGTIYMAECPPDVEPGAITGFIIVESDNEYIDLSVWHEEANKLLDHVRLVMSFCSGAMLRAPIIEFYASHKLEVVVSSQIRQASSASIPVCSYINRQPIFEAAVTSFLSPPFKVKNLSIAIDWFVMDSTYAEVCLVNAMTVLENLISSNLNAKDTLILKTDDFRELHKTLKDCIKKYSEEGAEKPKDGLSDLINHLQNLNRQSIVQKLYILAKLWTVPLDGISRKQIKTAKDARDSIVHRGHYDKDGSNDLWEHVTVVREIVVRFLFTAIGYQGRYISHLGGFHHAQFPPNFTGD